MNFSNYDFETFHPQKRKSREHNQQRLKVKRKLQKMGELIKPALKEADLPVLIKTSLHHPFIHNNFYVDSQWLYFTPAKKLINPLKDILGSSFHKELNSSYTHLVLVISIDYEKVTLSLKIHASAWWDGQNIKNKCAQKENREEFCALLQQAPEFSLKVHDWKKLYHCQDMKESELASFFHYYTPGEHWFHMDHVIGREDPLATNPNFLEHATKLFTSLVKVYRFMLWSPDNNFLFK